MRIQSISIVVPTHGCVNNCKFCVSKMHTNNYLHNFNFNQFEKRIKFAVNNNINTCILTGTGEVLQNKGFLQKLKIAFDHMDNPFPNIELQTSGVFLNDYKYIGSNKFLPNNKQIKYYENLELLKSLGVNTISLSISDIFDSKNNMEIIGAPNKLKFNLDELSKLIKKYDFNLRLSLNMIKNYNNKTPEQIIERCKELNADHVTIRKLYASEDKILPENTWVIKNKVNEDLIINLENHLKIHGNPLYKLPFGATVYSENGMSIVIDNNCMAKDNIDSLKYVILRENGKLYARWDDYGSLIF